MKVNLPSAQQLKHWIIFVLGLAAAGFAAYQTVGQSDKVTTTAIAAAIILSVERYVSDPSTGTPTTGPAPTPAASPPAT